MRKWQCVVAMALAATSCSIAHASFFDDFIGNVVGDNVRKGLAAQHGLTDGARRPQESQVFGRIAQAAGKKGLSLTFVGSRDINAFAAPGDQVFVTDGLMDAVQGQEQELAFCLGHEVSHITGGDTNRLARMALAESVLFGKAGANSQTVVALAERLLTYRQSQEQEFAADAKAMNLLHKSGYDLSGGLALMRRLETIKNNNPSIVDQLFATHPPTPERSERLKNQMFLLQYGTTFKLASVAHAATNDPSAWDWYDPAWIDAYKQATGRELYRLGPKMPGFENASQDNGNWYETKSWGGQCTWFVHAVLPDGAPSTLPGADTWAAAARNCPDKFAVDDQPAAGSVAIWGAVYHHVAFVTKVNDDGSIEVWDANYHDPTDQKVRGPRQLQPQDLQRFRMQYAHPLGGAPAQPAQPAPQPEPIPDSIVLCPGPIHLGDDVVTSRIIWSRTFSLDQPTVEHFSKSYVTFRLEATPKKDPRVCINRTLIGEAVARLGDWQAFRFAVPPGTLRVGGNLIDLETIIADLHNTFDDCEIKDITLTL